MRRFVARQFLAKLCAFFGSRRAEREMDREMAAHLALIEEDLVRRGASPREARLAARRAYGGLEQARELHRDERSFVWLEQALQDFRHAVRSLIKSPTFAAVALLSLALGIGVNTAVFTLVNGILLKTLPVPDPQRVVQLHGHFPDFESNAFNYPVFRELRRQTAIFAGLVGFSPRGSAILQIGGETRVIAFELVTGGYFRFFGARPALGRLLDEEDDRVEGAHPVCVLSFQAWQRYFAGDPKVLGRRIDIGAVPLEVVGVARPDFTGAELQQRYDVWAPTAMLREWSNRRENASYIWLKILGRLQPGVSFTEASARLAGASRGIEDALPKDRANANPVYQLRDASRGADTWRTDLHDPLVILMGAVSLVLLVACANLANLLLARTSERQREFAIKLSLGISRWRLLRQLLMETFALALAGGGLALLLSVALTRGLLDLFNTGRASGLWVAPDATVLLFTFSGCVLTALLAGLYPAWQAARTDASPALKGASFGERRRGLVRRALILVQVALATVLLFGASLFAHSLRQLKTVNLGFDIDHMLTVEIGATRNVKPAVSPPALGEVLARVRQLPGVESAALSDPGPLTGGMMGGGFEISDKSGRLHDTHNHTLFAGPGYFSTLHMPILRGRDIAASDRHGAPNVALVNRQLAAELAPFVGDPIGAHIPEAWGVEDVEIVGIVGDSHYQRIREKTPATLYLAFDQVPVWGATLEVRWRGALAPVEREIRRIVRAAAPGYQVSRAASMELLRDADIKQDRLLAFLSSLFGALGTALALVGIYGLIAYSVARRTREIGVRMSVGAQAGDVLWMFLRESLLLVALGVALGLPIALMLARFLGKLLFEVQTSDPSGIAATLLVIALGGLAASYIPGRRATGIDPVRALRQE